MPTASVFTEWFRDLIFLSTSSVLPSCVLPHSLQGSKYAGKQIFYPIRKNVCFWCIFGCWIHMCFQNFSVTHTFRSRSKGWNLLRQDTKVCFYRGRHEEFKDFSSQEDGVFCNDICSIMEVLCHEYNPDQWRLFIDSSKVSLNAVLLHNGNSFPSVPLVHTANMKESYESIWEILSRKNLSMWWSQGCGTVIGMQLGFTKYCCFLCKWYSREKKNHCVNKLWPKLTSLTPREKNVVNPPRILPEKIYLPPLRIKLGFMKTLWKVWIKPAVDSNTWGIIFQMWVTQKSRRVYL